MPATTRRFQLQRGCRCLARLNAGRRQTGLLTLTLTLTSAIFAVCGAGGTADAAAPGAADAPVHKFRKVYPARTPQPRSADKRCVENVTGADGHPISMTDPRVAGFVDAGGCLRQLQVGCQSTEWMGQDDFRGALRAALKTLGALGIPTVPVWGSALAVARGIQENPVAMPWDDDIDVAIDEEGVQQLVGPSGPASLGGDSAERCGLLDAACDITNTPHGRLMLRAWARKIKPLVHHGNGSVYRVSLPLLLGLPALDAADRRRDGSDNDHACVGFGHYTTFGVGWTKSGPPAPDQHHGRHLKAWYSAGCTVEPTFSSLFDLYGGVCSGRPARRGGPPGPGDKPGLCLGAAGWDPDRAPDESVFTDYYRYVKAGLVSTSVQSFGGTGVAAPPRKATVRFVAAIYGTDWNTSVLICPHSQFGYFPDCKKAGQPPLPLEAVRAAMAAIPQCAQ